MSTTIQEAYNSGQSIWLDYISKDLISSGGLQKWIDAGVTGVTTNPSIFENAIAKTTDYDKEIFSLKKSGKTAAEIYEILTLQEVGAAADILRPVYDRTGGKDGFVSLEVNPLFASDEATTITEAERLFKALKRPNVMIKIPATPEGISALKECISRKINVNSTLIFSPKQYAEVARAYIAGGSKAESVASVFVSRVDTAVDKILAEKNAPELFGVAAVAGIKKIYRDFQEIFSGHEKFQRPLWESTGTKDKRYSDVKYVEELITPRTVNTIPPATLDAFLKHGHVSEASGFNEAAGILAKVETVGVNLEAVYDKLLADGLTAFNASFTSLMNAIEKKGA